MVNKKSPKTTRHRARTNVHSAKSRGGHATHSSATSGGFTNVRSAVTPAGEAIVMMPRGEYERMTGLAAPGLGAPDEDLSAEDAADIRAYDQAKEALAAGIEEMLSDAEVDGLLAAPTPMAFWRKKRGLTQGDIAKTVGTSQSHISHLESGGSGMSFDTARKIAKALGVTLDDLAD